MGPGGISKEATEGQKGASTRETSENRHRLPRRPLVRGRCRLLGSKPAGQTTPNGPLAARNQCPASVRLEHICPGEGKAYNWRPPQARSTPSALGDLGPDLLDVATEEFGDFGDWPLHKKPRPIGAVRVLCASRSTCCWRANNKASQAQVRISQYRSWPTCQTACPRKMLPPFRQSPYPHLRCSRTKPPT